VQQMSSFKTDSFFQNPYPVYQEMRKRGQPVWLPHSHKTLTTGGTWLFANYDDIKLLFSAKDSVSHAVSEYRVQTYSNFYDDIMLLIDGAEHRKLRKLTGKIFSQKFLSNFEVKILQTVRDTLATILQKREIDFVRDYAEQIPLKVISELVGVPKQDTPRIRAWTLKLHDAFDSLLQTASGATDRRLALTELADYSKQQLDKPYKRHDSSTLISHLLEAELRGEITREDSITMVAFLLISGNATTSALISSTLWLLLSNPEQMALLRRNPDLLNSAILESLRYESPAQRTIFRVATRQIRLTRSRLEVGQQFSLIIGSANRDETIFEHPDLFNIRRNSRPNLSFGLGIHNCLGKHLAVMEAKIALRHLLNEIPNIQLKNDIPLWRKNSMFRELSSLPVTIS
jgi:pimeloyl-[acyl-carrier protein] synthase